MKTLTEICAKYAGVDCHTGTDKNSVHAYGPTYEEVMAPYRRPGVRMVEIGILTGHSLRMWTDYFEGGETHGVDYCDQPMGIADLRPMMAERKYNISILDATDKGQVDAAFGDKLFDVIVEDAGHSLQQQLALYAVWGPRLAPGGLYVIEDVENIDSSRQALAGIDPSRQVEILDLRSRKGRFDDVLVLIRASSVVSRHGELHRLHDHQPADRGDETLVENPRVESDRGSGS